MNITSFLAITVVGAFLAGVVQIIKKRYKTGSVTTRLLVVVLALLVGGGYVWLESTPYFQTAIIVLTTSQAVYAFFLKK